MNQLIPKHNLKCLQHLYKIRMHLINLNKLGSLAWEGMYYKETVG